MKIIGIGNALVDILIRLKSDEILKKYQLPKGGMTLVDHTLSQQILEAAAEEERSLASGGSAANTIHGLARLGISTAFIGKVGYDEMGRFFKVDMDESGIETLIGIDNEHITGKAVTLISPDSERTFATFLGAAIQLDYSKDIDNVNFNSYDILHLEGYLVANNELILESAKKAKSEGCKISIDLASFTVVENNREFLKSIIKNYVDIVFANEEEAKAYTGVSPEESLSILASECEIAVVKLGSNGSIIQRGDERERIGVIKANSIDTTGAGDLYAAGFLYGLSKGLSLKGCGEAGALLSGKVIENYGAKIDEATWKIIRTDLGLEY